MAYAKDDTIIAVATPPGRGGIGIVRVSGPLAAEVAGRMIDRPLGPPRYATLCRVVERVEAGDAGGPVEAGDAGGPAEAGDAGACAESGDIARGVGFEDAGAGAEAIDEVVATFFRAPSSYTGEDVVEIAAHGSPSVLTEILDLGVRAGARLAEPGEFTLRAFLNGRIDLVQAEAVNDLVEAVTPLQARAAFDQLQGTLTGAISAIEGPLREILAALEASIDFPGEGYEFAGPQETREKLETAWRGIDALISDGERGRLIREGRQVAVAGAPNVGKSSVFNMLAGAERAIVTPVPGTTRDLVAEKVDVSGLRLTLVDTAGLREPCDTVEQEGVRRAAGVVRVADAVLVVLDRSRPIGAADAAVLEMTRRRPRVLVVNKRDLEPAWDASELAGEVSNGKEDTRLVEASMKTGEGVEDVRSALARCLLGSESLADTPAVSNVRHLALLRRARAALGRAVSGDSGPGAEAPPLPEEFVAADVREALFALEEITGRRTTEDLLAEIFSRFCVGK